MLSTRYLKKIASKKIQPKTQMSFSRSLDVLAKSLLYSDYNELCTSYSITQSNSFFNSDSDNNNITRPYDIGKYGFIFSEYKLQEFLDIDFTQALALKHCIDYKIQNFSLGYSGIIHDSCIENIKFGLSVLIEHNKINRIIGKWPLSFNASVQKKKILFKSNRNEFVNCFYFGGFCINSHSYFINEENEFEFVKSFIRYFLKYNNVIFNNSVIYNANGKINRIIQYLIDNYESYSPSEAAYLSSKKEEVLFLPRQDLDPGEKEFYGEQIKVLRKERHLTLQVLADNSGLSTRQIINLEKGISHPRYDTMEKLAKSFNISSTEFLKIVQEKPNC